MIFNFLMVMSGQIDTAQVALASLQPVIDALQNNIVSLNALSAVTAKVPSAGVTGLSLFIQFMGRQNALIWSKAYTVTPGSLAAINQIIKSEGGAYIVMTPISNLINWRVSYSVYGAKSLSLVDTQTFELNFNQSGEPVPTNQVSQLLASNIQYQSQTNGKFIQLPPVVPINQATLL